MQNILSSTWQVAPSPSDGTDPVRFRLVNAESLTPDDLNHWRELSGEAGTSSPFAQDWFMRASLDHFSTAGAVSLAVIENRSGWIGAIPLVRSNWHGRMPMVHWEAWQHPNMFVGTPLHRRYHAIRFWGELLDGLGRESSKRMVLSLPNMPLDEPGTKALFDLCADQQRPYMIENRRERAQLDCRLDETSSVKPRQQKRVASLERKLAREVGEVSFDVVHEPHRHSAIVEEFLALERSGWKGQAGSALSCSPDTQAFFKAVVQSASQRGEFAVARLQIEGRPLAMASFFQRGESGFGFKMAFDEAYRSYAPGRLLVHRLTAYLRTSGMRRIDSCCKPGQEPLGSMWNGRREMADCCISIGGPLRRGLFRAMSSCQSARRSILGR